MLIHFDLLLGRDHSQEERQFRCARVEELHVGGQHIKPNQRERISAHSKFVNFKFVPEW
jgi:hypothetical protein